MRWMWIDRVVELQPGRRIVAIKNVSLAEDHLHDHFPASATRAAMPLLPASLIIEGMAQSAGILVGHAGAFREKVILAKVASVELTHDVTPGRTIRYTATIDRADHAGASTLGIVEALDPAAEPGSPDALPVRIGAIDLLFSHLDNNLAGAEFPADNFVFGDSFKMLLRTSGVAFPD